MDNSSVYDIYTGLKLDEEQVRAGRETEVKRMLEFEQVNEQQARGKRVWNSAWLDSLKRPGLVRLVVNQVRGASKREDVFAATPPLAAMRFILSRAASRGLGVASACGMCRWHSSTQRLRKECSFDRQRTCERTRSSGDS